MPPKKTKGTSASTPSLTEHRKKSSSKVPAIFAGVIATLAIIALSSYFMKPEKIPETAPPEPIKDLVTDVVTPKPAFAATFATYEEVPTDIRPSVLPYEVQARLANVSNAADFKFSKAALSLLVKNGFVVTPAFNKEYYPLYENNRYSFVPNFVTTDSMLHNYHLVFDHLLKTLEEEKLSAALERLNANVLKESDAQYATLKGTEWENAARRNVGFFSVGSTLLTPSVQAPEYAQSEVAQELALIDAHAGITISPVMNIGAAPDPLENLKEDYSQYVPRGHYDKSEQLKSYFKSLMWYGRLTFRLKNEDEIKSAVLATLALNQGDNRIDWNIIYEPTNFFVGKSDDITYYQFSELLEKHFGKAATAAQVVGDKDKFAAFVEDAHKLAPPQVNSIPIFNEEIQPDREKEIKGFRFMGQRFTVDANIFQRLIDREVPERMLPMALDIPAAMGSDEALKILSAKGQMDYDNYSKNMVKMRAYVNGLSTDVWTQNLYWGWMFALRPLLDLKPEGYPSFMRNDAWTRRDLNAYLGSWTELKHDTILYAKQVYAELGGGPGPEKKDDRGYVEPNVQVYARLASLLAMTSEGLELRGLLSEDMKDTVDKMETLALSLKTISEKELRDETLTEEEYELIRSYGGQLEHFWLEVNRAEMEASGSDPRNFLDENPAALVADVATDPNGKVLEEATGHINEIYVVVPVDGKLRIAKGGVFSAYEFPWPIDDRLTDKKWRELLNSEKPPAMPDWTKAFIAKE